MSQEVQNLRGIRLYKPGVIAAYLVLSAIPVGLLLYGLNILRRGQRWIGGLILMLSGALFVMIAAIIIKGGIVSGLGMVAVLMAILVYKMERRPYTLAIEKGATPAKWWPPLFLVLSFIIVVVLIVSLFAPEDNISVP